jgi:hypothetical protein
MCRVHKRFVPDGLLLPVLLFYPLLAPVPHQVLTSDTLK